MKFSLVLLALLYTQTSASDDYSCRKITDFPNNHEISYDFTPYAHRAFRKMEVHKVGFIMHMENCTFNPLDLTRFLESTDDPLDVSAAYECMLMAGNIINSTHCDVGGLVKEIDLDEIIHNPDMADNMCFIVPEADI